MASTDITIFRAQLKEINRLAQFLEQSFVNEEKLIKIRHDQIKNIGENKAEESLNTQLNEETETLMNTRQIFRLSIVIFIYSYIEFGFKKICDILHDQLNLELCMKDFSFKGINQFNSYLVYATKTNLKTVNQKLWNKISNIQKIRNVIAHRLGEVYDNETELHKLITKNTNLKLAKSNIEVDHQYILEIISCAENLFSTLEVILQQIYEKPF